MAEGISILDSELEIDNRQASPLKWLWHSCVGALHIDADLMPVYICDVNCWF